MRTLFGNTLVAAAIALTLCILSSFAHAAPSPADLGLDKSSSTGNLSVQDSSGTFSPFASVNGSTHVTTILNSSLSAIPNASLANNSVTVGSAACTLGGTCFPAVTVGGTNCSLGSSCAPSVTVNGTTCTLGSTCAPSSASSLTIGTSPTSGGAAGQLMFDTGSVLTESATLAFTTPTLKIVSNTGALAIGATPDTFLTRDAANALAQRNGTNAQLFSVYNTFTSATSYERAVFDWQTTANVLTIGTEKGSGAGAARNLEFVIGGVNKADYGVTNAGLWTFTGTVQFNGAINATNGINIFASSLVGTGTIATTNAMSSGSFSTGAITASTIAATSTISNSSGNITATSGSLVAGASATVSTGQIGYTNVHAVTVNCGSLAGSTGCVRINVEGTDRYVPYY